MRFTKPVLVSLSLSILTACGGSKTGTFGTFSSFEDNLVYGNEVLTTIATIPYTFPSTLPISGSATHTGIVVASLNETTAVAGEVILETDFSNDEITGAMGNFFGEDETLYDGTLDIENGGIDRNANIATHYTYIADINGTLTNGGDSHVVDGILDGDFTGSSYEYIEGVVSGTVTTNGNVEAFNGLFLGER